MIRTDRSYGGSDGKGKPAPDPHPPITSKKSK